MMTSNRLIVVIQAFHRPGSYRSKRTPRPCYTPPSPTPVLSRNPGPPEPVVHDSTEAGVVTIFDERTASRARQPGFNEDQGPRFRGFRQGATLLTACVCGNKGCLLLRA